MIVKKLEIPLTVHKIEALLPRLAPNHEKIPLIQSDLQKLLAGYRGEKALDYPLSFLPDNEYYILHDLRLYDGKHYFQIDVLILHTKFFLILEVKNIAGELYFDTEFNQLIRTKDGQTNGFSDPLTQLKRKKEQFKLWLGKNSTIPLHGFVVISNPSSIIRINHYNTSQTKIIIHRDILPYKIEQLQRSHSNEIYEEQRLKKLIKLLKKKHTPLDNSILEKYHISLEDIRKGVICDNCRYLPMRRINANWYCPNCHQKNRKAHLQALIDYYYIFGEKITNKEIRDFLQMESSYQAIRILKVVLSKSIQKGKAKEYYLSINKLNKLKGD